MKRCYVITFDLKNPGINQQELITVIKSAKVWAKIGSTSYLIISPKSAIEIRDILMKSIKINDKLYVGLLNNVSAWYGLGEDVSNWIINNQK
jgi:hypothetical protein